MIKLTLDIRFRASDEAQEQILHVLHSSRSGGTFRFSDLLHFGIDFDNMLVRPFEFNVENMDYGRFDGSGYLPRNSFQHPDYSVRAEAIAEIYPIPAKPITEPNTVGPLPVDGEYRFGDYFVYSTLKGWVPVSEFAAMVIEDRKQKFEDMFEFIQVPGKEIKVSDFKDGFDIVEVEKDTIEVDLPSGRVVSVKGSK